MKKLLVYSMMIFFCIFFTAGKAQAQQEMKAKKYENPKWEQVVFIKFKSGKYWRAKEIIKNYYVKASDKSGTPGPSSVMDIMSGEWDMMVVWDMKGGIDDMNWETSPDNVKWMNAMNEVAGGADKAKVIMDEFSSLVDRETSYLAKQQQL